MCIDSQVEAWTNSLHDYYFDSSEQPLECICCDSRFLERHGVESGIEPGFFLCSDHCAEKYEEWRNEDNEEEYGE